MSNFKNIIFDFGGVIIRIDYDNIAETFREYGVPNFEELYAQRSQDKVFDEFETGQITPEEFRDRIRSMAGVPLTDEQIDTAWNAILIDIPQENVETLMKLKQKYRLFLLSNTNAIHEEAFMEIIYTDYGVNILAEAFDKIYFSHLVKMRKPHREIFEMVLAENNLIASETLFVDDSIQHIEGAMHAGLQTLLVEKGKMVKDYFD